MIWQAVLSILLIDLQIILNSISIRSFVAPALPYPSQIYHRTKASVQPHLPVSRPYKRRRQKLHHTKYMPLLLHLLPCYISHVGRRCHCLVDLPAYTLYPYRPIGRTAPHLRTWLGSRGRLWSCQEHGTKCRQIQPHNSLGPNSPDIVLGDCRLHSCIEGAGVLAGRPLVEPLDSSDSQW